MRLGIACESGRPPAVVVDLLVAAGLPADELAGRVAPALVPAGDHTWVLGSGADLLTLCGRDAVDAAVVGKELLLELVTEVHELLDLQVSSDRLVVALAAGGAGMRSRVATRWPRVTRRHFAANGRQVRTLVCSDPCLALELGAADAVVELESVVRHLAVPLSVSEEIAVCSARLVAGRAARALAGEDLAAVVECLRGVLEGP